MKIRLLGTGAAEGIPAIYSDSRVSSFARQNGGRDVRSRSSALLDGHVKIDFGPDTLYQIHRDGLDARDWSAIVFTHSHDDHFSIAELQYFLYPFSHVTEMPMPIFANRTLSERINATYPDWPFELVVTGCFEASTVSGYSLTPVRAKHMDSEEAHNLLFSHAGRQLLYATDTGVWPEETWDFLVEKNIDLLVIECTSGRVISDYDGHLDYQSLGRVLERMHEIGALSSTSRVVSTHHSHNGDATHEELVQLLAPLGVEVGYDGIEVAV